MVCISNKQNKPRCQNEYKQKIERYPNRFFVFCFFRSHTFFLDDTESIFFLDELYSFHPEKSIEIPYTQLEFLFLY